ncbi:hypothetical protein C8J57DRAFT_1401282 [Mycena rebaudengoi]|nr:hypothetical protein C8J57DRAFT_1401282 [Mycena rebaudengoi]
MCIAEIPLDIILDVTHLLDLQDSLRLLATCSALQTLSSSRDFWLKALERVYFVHKRPIPCALGTDIVNLPLRTLQQMARHAYALMRNWARSNPAVVSVREINLNMGPSVHSHELYAIHGTNMVITKDRERFSCWDTISGMCLGEVLLPDVPTQMGRTTFDQPGRRSFALIFRKSSDQLEFAVICVDYQNPAQITVSRIYSNIWNSPDVRLLAISGITLDQKMIGMTVLNRSHHTASLLYCKFADDVVGRVSLKMPTNTFVSRQLSFGCILHQGEFYVAAQHPQTRVVEISHINVDTAPPKEQIVTRDVPRLSSGGFFDLYLDRSHMCSPRYGVLNVTTRGSHSLTSGTHTHAVYFWPAVEADHRAQLEFGQLGSYEHPRRIYATYVGSSGRYALITELQDDIAKIGLVTYHTHPIPHTTFHQLDTSTVDIEPLSNMALDDILGVLYVCTYSSDNSTSLSVISYV